MINRKLVTVINGKRFITRGSAKRIKEELAKLSERKGMTVTVD